MGGFIGRNPHTALHIACERSRRLDDVLREDLVHSITRDREVAGPGDGFTVLSCLRRTVVLLPILRVDANGVDILTIRVMRSEASYSPATNGQHA